MGNCVRDGDFSYIVPPVDGENKTVFSSEDFYFERD